MRVSQSLGNYSPMKGGWSPWGVSPCMSFDSMHGIPNGGVFSGTSPFFFGLGLVGTIFFHPILAIYIYIPVFSKYIYIYR